MNTLGRLLVAALSTGVLTGLAVVAPVPALADVGDGSFETPVVPPRSFVNVGAGAAIGAWTVSRGNVDLIGAGFWQAADGVQSVDLDGSSGSPLAGGVAQTFDTVPLLTYRVRYKLAGNPFPDPVVKTGELVVNGTVIQSFSFDVTGKSGPNMGWVSKQAQFIATGPSSTVELRSTTGTGFGPAVDDVNVDSCLLIICID